jgi:hypothetical protein
MRTMLKFSIPIDHGNDVIRTGKIGKVFEQLMQELSPEAAYFYPEAGQRAGIMVFNLQDESGVAGAVERFAFGLHANVDLTPVMNSDDLQKALGGLEAIVNDYS